MSYLFLLALIFNFAGIALWKWKPRFCLYLLEIAALFECVAIVWRFLLAQRAPIANMYETVLFCGFFALVMGIGGVKNNRLWLLTGAIVNLCVLLMVNLGQQMLNPEITPLMPVLRSNFWLVIHVTTVVVAYASFAMSWVMANIMILKKDVDGTSLANRAMELGVVFLVIGIITGAIWADYTWGRFWGWDPKETWALVVLLIYTVILHSKHKWNSRPWLLAPIVALAFLGVLMAWFGVNYILAQGLHSYGFSSGGTGLIILIFILQVVLVLVHFGRIARK